MAKQTGEYKITGTYDDVTYYFMEGQYYARKKSRLKGERVKRAKEFKRTMESARRLAAGSQQASKIYRSLPRTEQVYTLFCTLKSAAIKALKEGKSEAEVQELLRRKVNGRSAPVGITAVEKKSKVVVAGRMSSFWQVVGAYKLFKKRTLRSSKKGKAQWVQVLLE
jgi:hypothetical protein